ARVRRATRPALEVCDTPPAQARAFRQFLLRQASQESVPLQQRPERALGVFGGHDLPTLRPNPTRSREAPDAYQLRADCASPAVPSALRLPGMSKIMREGVPGMVLDALVAAACKASMRLVPLSADGTLEMVRRATSPDAEAAFATACHELTGGNPLL